MEVLEADRSQNLLAQSSNQSQTVVVGVGKLDEVEVRVSRRQRRPLQEIRNCSDAQGIRVGKGSKHNP
jgi:hypothetical protein